jgi:hypothetical protein
MRAFDNHMDSEKGGMMKKKLVMALIVGGLQAASAGAADNYTATAHPIRNLIFFSTDEPVYPAWAGLVQLMFDQGALSWAVNVSSCNSTSVAIRAADKHLIAAATSAMATDRGVRLYVDDAYKVSGVCLLRALQY